MATYKPLGTAISKQFTGLGVNKTNPELVADGTYLAILKKWNLESGAVDKILVNNGK